MILWNQKQALQQDMFLFYFKVERINLDVLIWHTE